MVAKLVSMVAKLAAGGQSRGVKVQQVPNEKVGTYWIRIYKKMILVKLHWMEAIEKMEYCVLEKDKNAGKTAEQVITLMLQEYSRQLFGFTRAEFDSIVEYDVLNIMASFYTKINAQQKKVIVSALQEEFSLCDLESVLENLAMYIDDKLYMPISCKLIDKLGDSRVTTVVYETLFKCCSNMLNRYWNQSNSYSNYLVLLNVGFFNALSYKLHIRDSYSNSMYNLYEQTGYDEFVESLYEKHLDDIGWDADVELDVIDELIKDSKINSTFDNGTQEEYMYAVETMKNICREHVSIIHKENEVEGFTRIVQKTGIRELKNMDIQGFECHFCEAKFSDEKYMTIFQFKLLRVTRLTEESMYFLKMKQLHLLME